MHCLATITGEMARGAALMRGHGSFEVACLCLVLVVLLFVIVVVVVFLFCLFVFMYANIRCSFFGSFSSPFIGFANHRAFIAPLVVIT